MSGLQRVVVTGMGVATALGCSVSSFWNGLLEGRSGVTDLDHPAFAALKTRIGAQVTGFDADALFGRKDARRMSRSSQLAMVAAAPALEQARLLHAVDPAEVAVIIGSSIGGFQASDGFFKDYYQNGKSSPLIIPISMNVGPAANVSIKYGFSGPLMTIDAACASSAHSIAYVFNLIRSGQLEIGVTGGADCPFAPGVVEAWCSMRALGRGRGGAAGACRPFSGDRDGLVLGEGAGILVLESEASALRRGVPILAEIKGYGATSDAHHLTQPSASGPATAMRRALRDAGLAAGEIDCINAHGTATPWNDKNETAAIKEVFADHAWRVPVVANKAALGHSIGASGAVELIASIQSLRAQVLPPTINYGEADPECDLDYVTEGKPRPWRVRNVLSNSFAFGGSNAALVVGEHRSAGAQPPAT